MMRLTHFAALSAMLMALVATAAADTFTWDGGGSTNNWSDDFNWAGNVEPDNDGTAAIVFTATSKPLTVVNQNWNINSLTFNGTAPNIHFDEVQNTSLTIQASTGFGIGLTNLANSVHSIENTVILGGSQIWNIATGLMGFEGDLYLQDYTLSLVTNGDGVILAGPIHGSAASALVKSGDADLLISGTQTNPFTGTTSVNTGTLVLGKSILGAPALLGPLVIGDGVGGVEADKVMWQGSSQADGAVVVNASGLADLNGFNEVISELTLAAGRVKTGAGTLTLNGDVATLAATSSARITVDSSGAMSLGTTSGSTIVTVADGAATDDLIIDGAISGAANRSLIKAGTGQLALRGAALNVYSGSTFARGGTLLLDKGNPDAAIRGDLLIGTFGPDSSVVRLAQNNQIQAASANEVTVGPLGILDTAGFSDAIGPLVIIGGRVTTGNGVLTVGFGVSSQATSQNGIISGNLSLNGSTQTFNIENGTAALDLEVSATVFNGGVNKTGPGTLVFRGANGYTGPTVVSGGTFLVNNTSGSGTGSGNVALNANATLGGSGSIAGSVSVASFGTLTPGDNIGDLSVGAVAFDSNARFSVELGGLTAGMQFDQLIVAGDALLNGLLRATLVNGYVPAAGNSFQILTAGGNLSGIFPVLNLPLVAGGKGLTWQVHYNLGDVTLQVLSVLLGDYNGNGVVDAADYTVWRNTLGQSGIGLAADGNGNNQIDPGDYNVWKTHFGEMAGSGTAAGANAIIPEPTTLISLVLGMLIIGARRQF